MNKTITLYGHLIVDKIIVDFKEKISLGGIANVWHGIKFLTQNIIVNIYLLPPHIECISSIRYSVPSIAKNVLGSSS